MSSDQLAPLVADLHLLTGAYAVDALDADERVTPQLAAQIADRDIEVVLLFGARTPEELLYGDEFRAFANVHPNFRFVPCFSRELPAPDSPHAHADVRRGYVQDQLAEFAPQAESDIAYLCGNPNMVDVCFEALKGHGLPIPQIRREKYVSSK